MFISFFNGFTKLTAWPIQKLCFRTKIYYENADIQKRQIKGPAIIVCNHTSVFDYAVLLFVFFWRTLRCQVAELIFRKKPLGLLIRLLGGIRVDRTGHDFTFIHRSADILRRGGVVLVFPESRIPRPEEQTPLEFKPSAAYLALYAGVPVIPVYTNGSYFAKKRARVIIGTPMHLAELCREEFSEKQNIAIANDALRERIIALKEKLDEQEKK